MEAIMLNIRNTFCIFLFLLFVFVVIPYPAQAQTPQETLNQYIADLQKSPNDNALREKIIKHVQTMKPAPAIPEEAQKHMDRGIAAIESAKTAEDFQDAAVEFMKAVTAAPWHANGYRNLAIAQDKAGQYDTALKNLQLYLLTMPSSSDEAWAKTLINKIEYRKEKVAKESSPETLAAKKQKEFDEWLKKLDGISFTGPNGDMFYIHGIKLTWAKFSKLIDIYGKRNIYGPPFTHLTHLPEGWYISEEVNLLGREFRLCPSGCTCCPKKHCKYYEEEITTELKGIISDDGDTITIRNTCGETEIYRREK
jgi:tetratricopeptide (TPR) repeat protein